MNVMKRMIITITAAVTIMSSISALSAIATYPATDTYNTTDYYVYGNANITDTFWTAGNNPYRRRKTNSTSVYVNNTSSYGTYMDIWGLEYAGSTDKIHVGSAYAGASPTYRDEQIWVPYDGPRFVNQFVYERGLLYVAVYFHGVDGGSGYWSPDSIGSYPVINNL